MNVVTIDLGRSATRLHPLDEKVAREYTRGWDETGIPTREKRELLHLLEGNAILTGFSRAPEDTDRHAYMLTSSLEASAFFLYHLEAGKEYRKFSDNYKTW